MKRVILLLILFASAMTVWPSPVSSGKAKQWALDFFRDRSQTRGELVSLDMVWDGEDNASRANSAPSFYVFNRTDRKGFVVVAGDDVVNPLIGYSFENNFNYTNLPENIRLWFEDVKREIKAIRNSSSRRNAANEWQTKASVGSDVIKHETALWDQDHPYNLYCPKDLFTGKTSLTGCTATAMAIVMRGYKWPAMGIGSLGGYSYSIKDQNNVTKKQTMPERSVAHVYDWDNMPLRVDGSTTQSQKEAIASLMLDCGQMAISEYQEHGTGGQPNAALTSLHKNFSYSSEIQTVKANTYTADAWISLMKQELQNGQVLYGGFTANMEGHAFVLYGYTSTDYFAVNWGWNGYCNGYYKLTQLDPEGQGSGGSATGLAFNYYQDAVVNFKKEIVSLPALNVFLDESNWGIRTATEVIKAGETIHVEEINVSNGSSQEYQGDAALCLFDSDHRSKAVLGIQYNLSGLGPSYYVTFPAQDLTIPSTAKKGDYIAMGELKAGSAGFTPIKGDDVNLVYKLEIGGFDHALSHDLIALAEEGNFKEKPFGLHTSIDEIEKNVKFTVSADLVVNITKNPVNCQIGVGVYSRSHKLKSLVSEDKLKMDNTTSQYSLADLTFNCMIKNDIAPGDYISLCYTTDNGTNWYRVRALDNIKAHITLMEMDGALENTTIEYDKTSGAITVENSLADEYYVLKDAKGATVQEGLGDKAFVIDTKNFKTARYVLWIYLSKGAKECSMVDLTFGQK